MLQTDYRKAVLDMLSKRGGCRPVFIPRLDIWHRANRYAGTLPERFRDASPMDIADALGIGTHAVVPDFRDFGAEDDDRDIGLGIYRFRTLPYRVRLSGVAQRLERRGDTLSAEYETPFGCLRTRIVFDGEMRRSGSTLPHKAEYAVKGVSDFKAAAYVLERAEVTPDYAGLAESIETVGRRGPVAAFASFGASPMHYVMKELMPLDLFFYAQYDEPDKLAWLASKIEGYCDRVFSAAAESPADIVFLGANYDSSFTQPRFFGEWIAPCLRQKADILHAAGKYLLTHTDGENRGLLGHYLDAGIDIADSICPRPMTSQPLREVLDAFSGNVTVWGGIPSVSVVEDSMGDDEFRRFLDETLGCLREGDRVIFSIADTAPPGMKFERLEAIAERVGALRDGE